MQNDRDFYPEFGPNGAVLNSPHMSDRMRAEILRPWPNAQTPRDLRSFVVLIVLLLGVLALAFAGEPVWRWMRESGDPRALQLWLYLSGVLSGLWLALVVWRVLLWSRLRRAVSASAGEFRLPPWGMRRVIDLLALLQPLLLLASIPQVLRPLEFSDPFTPLSASILVLLGSLIGWPLSALASKGRRAGWLMPGG